MLDKCSKLEEETLYAALETPLRRLLELKGYGGAGYGDTVITLVNWRITYLKAIGAIKREEVSAQK